MRGFIVDFKPLTGRFGSYTKYPEYELSRDKHVITYKRLTDTGLRKKFATGLWLPFVNISLRASFYPASHFST